MPPGPTTLPWILCGVIPLAPWISLLSLSRLPQNPLLRSRFGSLLTPSLQNVHKISRKVHFITKNLEKKKKNQVKPVTGKWQWLAYPALSLLSGEQRFLPFYSPSSFFSIWLLWMKRWNLNNRIRVHVFRGSWIAVRIRQGGEPAGISLSPRRRRRRRSSCAAVVRAEVSFVGADEAKRLVDEEGYTVLDIRDRTQRERAYIKSSTHVPLFIENQDNDIGTQTTAAGAAVPPLSPMHFYISCRKKCSHSFLEEFLARNVMLFLYFELCWEPVCSV